MKYRKHSSQKNPIMALNTACACPNYTSAWQLTWGWGDPMKGTQKLLQKSCKGFVSHNWRPLDNPLMANVETRVSKQQSCTWSSRMPCPVAEHMLMMASRLMKTKGTASRGRTIHTEPATACPSVSQKVQHTITTARGMCLRRGKTITTAKGCPTLGRHVPSYMQGSSGTGSYRCRPSLNLKSAALKKQS